MIVSREGPNCESPSKHSRCQSAAMTRLSMAATTLHAATRGLCSLSITLNFKFCTSPLWTLSVGVFNPSSRIFFAFAATYSWGGLFNSCIPIADATPTGKAPAAHPESIVRSILSLIPASQAVARPATDAAPASGSLPKLASLVGCTFHVGCTDEETCNLGPQIVVAFRPLLKGRAPFLPLPPLPFPFGFRTGQQSFCLWPYMPHQSHCRRTSPTCFLGLFLCRLSCLCLARASTSMSHSRLPAGTSRSTVSPSQGNLGRSLHSKVVSKDLWTDLPDARHVCWFPETLHVIAKISGEPPAALARVSPCLPPRLRTQLALAEATSPATICSAKGCGDHTCDSAFSRHPAPLPPWCCAQSQSLRCALPWGKPDLHGAAC